MQKASFVVIALCILGAFAMPYEAWEEDLQDDGEYYYLVPVQRVRRGVDISSNGRVTASHGGTIHDSPNHRVDGSGFASKPVHPSGPLTVGGRVDYSHKPSGSGFGIGAQNTRRQGTDVSATGNLNLYRGNGGRTTVDANAGYNRHFGGPGGTGKPNYGGSLNVNHRW